MLLQGSRGVQGFFGGKQLRLDSPTGTPELLRLRYGVVPHLKERDIHTGSLKKHQLNSKHRYKCHIKHHVDIYFSF